MTFYATVGERPVFSSEATRQFAFESLNHKYGLDTKKVMAVKMDDIPDFDKLSLIEKNDLMIDSDDLAKLTDFAFGMAQKAFASIMEGNIAPYPMQNGDKLVCDYCPYLAMCKFHQGKGDAKRMIEKKTFAQLFAKEDGDGTHN